MPPVIDLIDDNCLYVSAPIDEVDAAQLRVGQSATILLDALPQQRFPARVRRIAPYVKEVEKQARTVEIEAEFTPKPADLPLLIGYSADVEVEIARAQMSCGCLPKPAARMARCYACAMVSWSW